MKIAFDGKRALQNFTGLGNYSRYLLSVLCTYYPEHTYILCSPKPRANKKLEQMLHDFPNLQLLFPKKRWEKKAGSVWRSWSITQQLERENITYYHGLSNELPLNMQQSAIKSVVTVHDLIFLRLPHCYPPIDRLIYTYKFKKACQQADKIVAISECTKRDIMHFFHIPADKITVIYQGCDSSFQQRATEEQKKEVQQRYQLPKKFILNVGSLETRKNALLLVKSLPSLPADTHVVLVGKQTPYVEEIKKVVAEQHLEARVHLYHQVPFTDLPIFYQLAHLFAYPSRFEGFGIPIIEALHSGIPVIAATGSCLEEAGGSDSLYIHPDDVAGFTQAYLRIEQEEGLRERMIEKGYQYVTRFADQKIANDFIHLYTQL